MPPVPASPVAEEADFEMSLDDMRATARATTTAKRKAKAKKAKARTKAKQAYYGAYSRY